ncbi:MAG: protein-disulfide reductase DsbD domain-containing protein [Pseudomonadota bacterium]
MLRLFTAAVFLATSSLPLVAQANLDPVEARILPGWILPDGRRVAAIDMKLAPGWKTYWRAPGDGGIPPAFDWSGSQNVSAVEITWPAPRVFDQNGMRSYGYEDRLVLPLTISPRRAGKDVELNVNVDMGVCADICIPYQLSLSGALSKDDNLPTPEIAGALAQRPYTAQDAGVTSATCRIEPTDDGLRIEARVLMPPAGDSEVIVFEPGLPEVWVSEAKTQRYGGEVMGTSELVHTEGGYFAIDRSAIRITVLGQNHAVDIQGCSAG